jgi:hypothetical protein
MKKILLSLLLAVSSLQASERLVSQDPVTNSGKMKVTGMVIAGGMVTSANVIASGAVQGTNTGPAVAGTVIKAASNGLIAQSLFNNPIIITNSALTTEVAATINAWTNLVTITLPQTNGTVIVTAQAQLKSKDSTASGGQGLRILRLTGSGTVTTNIATEIAAYNATSGIHLYGQWVGNITETNTFVLEGVSSIGSAQLVWGGTSKEYYMPTAGVGTGNTNSTSLTILYNSR